MAVKSCALRKQPHEHFLSGILSVVGMPEQAKADPPDPLAVAIQKFHESGPVGTFARGFGGKRFIALIGKFQHRVHARGASGG